MSDDAACPWCGVWVEDHNYEHMARDCYPKRIDTLQADHARLVALVRALPLISGEIVVEGTDVTWDYGGSACMDTQDEAKAYAALLAARQELGG